MAVSDLMQAIYERRGAEAEAIAGERGDETLDVFELAALGRATRLKSLLKSVPELARAFSADGFTALHFAAFFGGEPVGRVLLEAGADPDAQSRNEMQVRPLHSAVAGGKRELAFDLVGRGVDVNARQRHGWTPLHAAADIGELELVRRLLEAGADPRLRNDDGASAHDLAVRAGHDAVAVQLKF